MDSFVLPSHFEGLPVSLIEAQIAGLQCYFTDTMTPEVIISNNTHLLSPTAKPETWARKILDNRSSEIYSRDLNRSLLDKFDINKQAVVLQQIYA
jgi:glycosyltransferase involved in cell wall biosynthesis